MLVCVLRSVWLGPFVSALLLPRLLYTPPTVPSSLLLHIPPAVPSSLLLVLQGNSSAPLELTCAHAPRT